MQIWSLRSYPALAPCSDVCLLKIVTRAALEKNFVVKGDGVWEILRSWLCCILWLCDFISDFEMLLQSRNGGFYHGIAPAPLTCLDNTGKTFVISGFLQIFLYKIS